MAVKLSALRSGRALLRINIICLLLVLVSVTGSESQGLVRPEVLGKFKRIPSPHPDSNPRPSGLWHSTSTTTLPLAMDIGTLSNFVADFRHGKTKHENSV
jgi:hypothetical protein